MTISAMGVNRETSRRQGDGAAAGRPGQGGEGSRRWIQTTPDRPLSHDPLPVGPVDGPADLEVDGRMLQSLRGFGGCFNELGWTALAALDRETRQAALADLFSPEGLGLGFNRTPVGANDFASSWYSYDETPGDWDLHDFSLSRDEEAIIPYIRAAQAFQPGMGLFASPWSPPTWMKNPPVYNYGKIVMDRRNLETYARYLLRYVEGYRERGIRIDQLHVQNEVFADQKFPSCLWSSDDMRIFIRDYLGPLFHERAPQTAIFLGTLNGPTDMAFTPSGMALDNYNRYVDNILFDDECRRYISGIGYQWEGRNEIERTHRSWPEIELEQTESECGTGDNSWEYAEYIFGLINRYLTAGATCYTYWNMALDQSAVSTWGWRQNSLLTVDRQAGVYRRNPEYYVMRHFSHYVHPGARLLETGGHFGSLALAFANPDGSRVVVAQNPLDRPLRFAFADRSDPAVRAAGFDVTLQPRSFNTFTL